MEFKKRTDSEGERLQDVSLNRGGQQDDGHLRTVLVPVHVKVLTLQQLQTAFVWKHLTKNTRVRTVKLPEHTGVYSSITIKDPLILKFD